MHNSTDTGKPKANNIDTGKFKAQPPAFVISDALRARFDREVAKYPPGRQQSAVMACLAMVQEEQGWLSEPAMEEVARYLAMAPVAVYEVATFYNMYQLKPAGRHILTLCTNLPCALSGAQDVAEHLQKTLGIAIGETTPDGRITLKVGECMGACGEAPVLLVNNRRLCARMSPQEVDVLLRELP